MSVLLRFLLPVLFAVSLFATSSHFHEKHYQALLCARLGGQMEYRLIDRTRVDCLTDEYAIEVDFAKKWAEGIGQSLYYSSMTQKKPAVALIVGEDDERFLKRLQKVAEELQIKVFIISK